MKYIKDKLVENFNISVNLNKENNLKINSQGKMGNLQENLCIKKNFIIQNQNFFFNSHCDSRNLYGKIKKNIKSVLSGYYVELKIVGLGYAVYKVGNSLVFDLGYSHFISYTLPSNIITKIEGQTLVFYSINDSKLKAIVSLIKKFKQLNIYKGTGILNKDEKVNLKKGKTR